MAGKLEAEASSLSAKSQGDAHHMPPRLVFLRDFVQALRVEDASDTYPFDTPKDRAGAGDATWYLVVALEATRPFAGALRISLTGVREVSVGRGSARAVTRDGARLRIDLDDRYQSKAHFRLSRKSECWQLEDCDSKNGTRWRGSRAMRAWLSDGDVIEAGASFFVIREARNEVSDRELMPELGDNLGTLQASFGNDLDLLRRLAPTNLPILINGESGSGKELAARAIHSSSDRRGPLIAVNCGAMPAALAEAELFGARRGAFSGAVEDRLGLVRAADKGTLFLDEIADLPLPAQASLLRFLQEGEVRALGAQHTAKVDVRVVAASHRDLDDMVARETFRHDLLARLRGHVLRLPALRDRREDLGILCAQLLQRIGDSPSGGRTLQRAAGRALFAYNWPGNVRELEHALRFAVARGQAEIGPDDLPEALHASPNAITDPIAGGSANPDEPGSGERQPRAASLTPDDQRARIVSLLEHHGGNLSAVARALETSRSQLRRLMERYQIEGRHRTEP
jgi:DNA-binding NtrC family response regulator